jgi:hypothetical protein
MIKSFIAMIAAIMMMVGIGSTLSTTLYLLWTGRIIPMVTEASLGLFLVAIILLGWACT